MVESLMWAKRVPLDMILRVKGFRNFEFRFLGECETPLAAANLSKAHYLVVHVNGHGPCHCLADHGKEISSQKSVKLRAYKCTLVFFQPIFQASPMEIQLDQL
jgi:hypothetical protein